jgi:P4 family phage/plasmid primase-like protien
MSIAAQTDKSGADAPWRVYSRPLGDGTHLLRLVPPDSVIDLSDLLDVLDFKETEFVSICHKIDGRFISEVCAPTDAVTVVKRLPNEADVWFGINPTCGPTRRRSGRGTDNDVTRLAVLPADLDISDGKCPDKATAHAIINELSAVLRMRPAAITDSGNGLHVYWPIRDGSRDGETDLAAMKAVLKRWGRLVKAIAKSHGAKVDSVFDPARILRVPATFNNKAAPKPVVCQLDTGDALTLDEAARWLEAYGIHQIDEYPDDGATISNPDDWEFASETCNYTVSTIDGWADVTTISVGTPRHPWYFSQAVRLNCARMLTCVTESEFDRGKSNIASTFRQLLATHDPVRNESVGEIADMWDAAVTVAATKTLDEARGELGNHKHLWPAPDNPRSCAKRIVGEAKLNRKPLRFWNGTWFEWNGTHYRKKSHEELRDDLYDVLADAEYLGAGNPPAELRWKPTTKKLNDVIDAARGLVALPVGMGASEWLDGHQESVIACANGLLRVRDRELLSHTPEFFNTFALGFDYQPRAAKAERWLKFLKEIFSDDPEATQTLQEWFGYVLSGRTDLQKMLLTVGPTRSGKGTVVKILVELIGQNSVVPVTDTMLSNDFGLAPLIDKTLAVFSDTRVTIKGKKLVETLLSITGEDMVPVNRKYREAVSAQLSTRFMIQSNETLVLPDNSSAIVGRIIALCTPNSWLGREEIGLAEVLKKELPAILNWSLDGEDSLRKRGYFEQPESGQAILDLLGQSASPIKQFIEETCVFVPHDGDCVYKDRLYEHYKAWCYIHGHPAHSDVHLARVLYAAYGDRIRSAKRGPRGEQRPVYTGIALRPHVRERMP